MIAKRTIATLLKIKTPAAIGVVVLCLTGCAAKSGPDKTVGGALVGAAWGMGTGAIVGNQVSSTGEGLAVGAGLGAVAGAMTGAGYDITESGTMALQEKVQTLDVQNNVNSQALLDIQQQLDFHQRPLPTQPIHKVLFDEDVTSLRSGASMELESVTRIIKRTPYINKIKVRGHADDSGSPEYNKRLSEARARSVVGYLTANGIDRSTISVEGFGSTTPLASNITLEGRQMNRRVEIVLE
jgi:outer membrane protein OmpA-like peptidoglycan-associated protein